MEIRYYLQGRFTILIGLFMLSAAAVCSAEEITLTTYYPSPYGVYSEMRLYPKSVPTSPCQEGTMYYDIDDRVLKVCDGGGNPQPIGGGYWALTGTNLYPNDLAWNVGIGTQDPGRVNDFPTRGRFAHIMNLNDAASLILDGNLGNADATVWLNSQSAAANSRLWSICTNCDGMRPGSLQIASWNDNKILKDKPITINNDGCVGIGAACLDTSEALTIVGDRSLVSGSEAGPRVSIRTSGSPTIGPRFRLREDSISGGTSWVIRVGGNAPGEGTPLGTFAIMEDNGSIDERLIIAPGGRIGIGREDPQGRLHVASRDTTGTRIIVENTDAGGKRWDINSAGTASGIGVGNFAINELGLAAHLAIGHTSGNVGIGTGGVPVSEKLYVKKSGAGNIATFEQTDPAAGAIVSIYHSGVGREYRLQTTTSGGFKIRDNTVSQDRFIITSDGNVGIGNGFTPTYQLQLLNDSAGKPNGGSWQNSSDERLKTEIKPLAGALEKIIALKGVQFEWKNPDEHASYSGEVRAGFLAQEVEKVFPNFIKEIEASGKDKMLVPDGKAKSLSLPFDFDAYLVEAIKELKAENDALKARLDELEKKLK